MPRPIKPRSRVHAPPKPAHMPPQGPGYVPLSAIDGDVTPEDVTAEAEARKYFAWLADVASVSGVTVDLFAAGLSAVNIPLVGPVASKSGGVLNLQEGELFSMLPITRTHYPIKRSGVNTLRLTPRSGVLLDFVVHARLGETKVFAVNSGCAS